MKIQHYCIATIAICLFMTDVLASDFITCESKYDKRTYCSIRDAQDAAITLYNKMSKASCDEGRSWGRDNRGVWVDRGCRAEFEVQHYNDRDARYGSNHSDHHSWDSERDKNRELALENERLALERDRLEQERNRLAAEATVKQETCPSGFRPGRCSDKQRKHGCKDIGLPGGLVCFNK